MKRIVLFYFLLLSLTGFGRTLEIDPAMPGVAPYAYADSVGIDTLKILPGNRHRVIEIGEYAFWNCKSLKHIELPKKCRLNIKEGAFRDCTGLIEINLPYGTTFDGQYIFSGCSSLKSVNLPASIITIPPHTFSYCTSLPEITLHPGIRKIGNNAFSECSALRSVELPDMLMEIESYAFSGCVSMTEASLPSNGNLLGELIFSGCTNLKTLKEMSIIPPKFDCDSSIFEPDDKEAYSRCVLIVRKGLADKYRKAGGWRLFVNIKEQGL